MASILTGVECAGAKSLLGDETRPMDSIEKISREVAEFIDNTSEATDASDSEPFVGCRRGPGPGAEQVAGSSGGLDPGLILANLRRLEPGKHFGSRGPPPPPYEDTDLSLYKRFEMVLQHRDYVMKSFDHCPIHSRMKVT